MDCYSMAYSYVAIVQNWEKVNTMHMYKLVSGSLDL